MAAGDFSSSALKNVLIEINQVFNNGGGTVPTQFDLPKDTAEFVLGGQTFKTIPIYDNQGNCNSVEAYYWLAPDTAIGYSGTSKDSGYAGCDLPSATESESNKVTIAPDVFINEPVAVLDGLCSNAYEFQELAANSLNRAMAKIRQELNKLTIQHLDANNMASPGVGSTGFAVTSNVIDVPTAQLTADLVPKLYEIAAVNQLGGNFRVMSGTNLFNAVFSAGLNALDDDKRSQAAKFNLLRNIGFDLRAMDTVTSNSSTFLYNPDSIGFFNLTPNPARINYSLTQMPAANGMKYIFLMNDPVLRYMKTDGTGTGRLVPVTYIVEYQQICSSTDANGIPTTEHRWLVRFVGGLHQAPTVGGKTGIIQLKKVA